MCGVSLTDDNYKLSNVNPTQIDKIKAIRYNKYYYNKGDLCMKNVFLFVPEFIDYCAFRKDLNSKTIKAYSTDLRQMSEYIQSLDKASI